MLLYVLVAQWGSVRSLLRTRIQTAGENDGCLLILSAARVRTVIAVSLPHVGQSVEDHAHLELSVALPGALTPTLGTYP